jgi:glycosyltransferase involved in cell wall biosynthesis
VKLALVVPGGVDASGTHRVIPSLLWLVERLARRHEVHVFALRQQHEPAEWNLLGARVHNVGWSGAWRRRLFACFAEEHRQAPFDVIHVVFGGAGAYAAVLGWRHRVPMLLHLAGGELADLPAIGYGMRNTLRGRIALRVAFAGARVVTVATPFMRRLAERAGVHAGLVPLGVARDRWPVLAPRPRDPTRPARLLHIGDLRPVKDQRTLLEAVRLLLAQGVNLTLDIAGHDTTGGALQRSAAAAAVAHATRWHGLLDRAALRALVEESDLLVVTSRHEAGPVAVLEAAIAGVPTVGTAVGHIADWAPGAAVAVRVGDAAGLAREVGSLLADDPHRLAIAGVAQNLAATIDADHTAGCFERIYEELVSRRPSVVPDPSLAR